MVLRVGTVGVYIDWKVSGLMVVFFFQAEDGIRDLVRSRGLGDVYKRQPPASVIRTSATPPGRPLPPDSRRRMTPRTSGGGSVSYTHLTLPTIYSV